MALNNRHTSHPPGYFCEHGPIDLRWQNSGTLAGLRLGVKDLFALEGERNTAGNPSWKANHDQADKTASSLALLLNEGAVFSGFTVTDELAYSLEGCNEHYGCATNPKVPGHLCGGSSMGSAAVVAADLADIALGTDTGGSVRVPASYCGIYGMRPSHGAVPTDGLIPLAPRFDTVGWFANTLTHMRQLGQLLLKPPNNPVVQTEELTLCISEDLTSLAEKHIQSELARVESAIACRFKRVKTTHFNSGFLRDLPEVFRILQASAVTETHGKWLREAKPVFAPTIARRFDLALQVSDKEIQWAEIRCQQWRNQMPSNLDNQSVLLLPTTPTTAPAIGSDQTYLRERVLNLTAVAGLCGAPQIHLPWFNLPEGGLLKPSGFSLMMPSGQDHQLLSVAEQLARIPGMIHV